VETRAFFASEAVSFDAFSGENTFGAYSDGGGFFLSFDGFYAAA
jgi:hypothetical protein